MKFDSDLEQRKRAGMMALFALVNNTEKIVAVELRWYGVGVFYRVNEKWEIQPENPELVEDATDVFINPDRAIEFFSKWDTEDSELNSELDFYRASAEDIRTYFPSYALAGEETFEADPIVSAIGQAFDGTCPPATQDIMINLENRNKAIKSVGYGPLNPDRPNVDFWEEKAKLWQTSTDEAKSSRCANCAVFIKTPEMLQCIESGLSRGDDENAWDSVEAGDLGYCEALDFKCAAGRTCDAWVAGGPVTGKDKDK